VQALLQRVSEASVTVENAVVGQIGQGLLVLICAEHGDTDTISTKLLEKILKLRIFSDEAGKMNLSVQDINGALLIVSQFTLAADTSKGTRPSFGRAANSEQARYLYDRFVELARQSGVAVQTGIFAADMKVVLVNDGPVTIPLSLSPTGNI
jgi:D-tyrosyl-tRNA(Tyr) deacylase